MYLCFVTISNPPDVAFLVFNGLLPQADGVKGALCGWGDVGFTSKKAINASLNTSFLLQMCEWWIILGL